MQHSAFLSILSNSGMSCLRCSQVCEQGGLCLPRPTLKSFVQRKSLREAFSHKLGFLSLLALLRPTALLFSHTAGFYTKCDTCCLAGAGLWPARWLRTISRVTSLDSAVQFFSLALVKSCTSVHSFFHGDEITNHGLCPSLILHWMSLSLLNQQRFFCSEVLSLLTAALLSTYRVTRLCWTAAAGTPRLKKSLWPAPTTGELLPSLRFLSLK